MTRDFLIRWTIAVVVGLAIAPLAQSFEDRVFIANSGAAPIPERTLVRSPEQPRGVLHHNVVPGKVSEDAVGAAGATLPKDASAGGIAVEPTN